MPAIQIEALWSGLNDPDNGKSFEGARVGFYNTSNIPQAVWYDREKTLPTVAGVTSSQLDNNGQGKYFGDGTYNIKIYEPDDEGLTTPIYTIDGAAYEVPTQLEVATTADMLIGANDEKFVSPLKYTQRVATETQTGLIELASQDEVDDGFNATHAITPKKHTEYHASIITPSENTVGTIDGLRSLGDDFDINTSMTVLGYNDAGDGGGGPIRLWVDGSPPGTYVDNGGSIIVPTGGDGSGAWVIRDVDIFDVRWFGAVGDATTDDTLPLKNTLSALESNGGTIYVSKGVYAISESVDMPPRVHWVGDGSPQIATFPQTGGDKSLLRPGYKDNISGSCLLFGAVTNTYTTNRSDRYASMTYAMAYESENSSFSMRDMAIIQDMDVLASGGTLTTSANDNRADIDAGLILNSYAASLNNVCLFGYFNDVGLVVHNDLGTASEDPDYNTFTSCSISGGAAILGSDTAGGAINEGNTGQRFIGCGNYAADHHTRADGDYTIPAIYIDGYITSAAAGIRGHTWIGGNIRTYANDAIVTDHAEDIQFANCVTEFPVLSGVTNADALGGFVGTPNTKSFRAFGLASTHSQKMDIYASQITGPFQIVGAGGFDHAIFGQDGSGVRILGIGNDSSVQLTDDFTSTVTGWLIQRDGDANDLLTTRHNNTIISGIDKNGGMRWGGMGLSNGLLTINAGEITLGSFNNISIATEGGASTDDLATITGGKYDGEIIIIRAASSSNSVVAVETGNLRLEGDFTMDNSQDRLMLVYDGVNWIELSRSNNTA